MTGQVDSIFREVDRLEEEQKWPEALEATRRADAAVAGGEALPGDRRAGPQAAEGNSNSSSG